VAHGVLQLRKLISEQPRGRERLFADRTVASAPINSTIDPYGEVCADSRGNVTLRAHWGKIFAFVGSGIDWRCEQTCVTARNQKAVHLHELGTDVFVGHPAHTQPYEYVRPKLV
jgi:hypothetical protein